jgi:cytidylate kinase
MKFKTPLVESKTYLTENIEVLKEELYDLRRDMILQLIIEGVDDPGILKCVFLAGGPGSGKSYTARGLFGFSKDTNISGVPKKMMSSFSSSGLKLVNSDTMFERELKKNGINPRELATIADSDPELWDKIQKGDTSIRGKAKSLTKKQQEFYEAGRLGMILDGTGKDFSKIKAQKDRAESLGYDTYMLFVNTSLKVALERNKNRERVLKDDEVAEMWKSVQENLGGFQNLFGSPNFTILDNTVYGLPPSNIQKAINEFVRRPIYNPIGKKWINTARQLKNKNLIK